MVLLFFFLGGGKGSCLHRHTYTHFIGASDFGACHDRLVDSSAVVQSIFRLCYFEGFW